jgi:hypothetical protein
MSINGSIRAMLIVHSIVVIIDAAVKARLSLIRSDSQQMQNISCGDGGK